MLKKIIIPLFFVCIILTACTINTPKANKKYEKQAIRVMKTTNLFGQKFDKSSSGLAKLYADELNARITESDSITFDDNSVWTFVSDGKCIDESSCKIAIKIDGKKVSCEVPIQIDKQGLFVIEQQTEPQT